MKPGSLYIELHLGEEFAFLLEFKKCVLNSHNTHVHFLFSSTEIIRDGYVILVRRSGSIPFLVHTI